LIYKFADYGFNKSHSLAYSYLAYQTAWLKAHYPTEFLASVMTSEIDDQDKIVQLIDEAKKFGIKVLPPDINKSKANFIGNGRTILFGLAAIKNVGVSAVNKIVEARQTKPFKDIFDFAERIDYKILNRRLLEALICSGAFDTIHPNQRASLYESIDLVIEYAKSLTQNNSNIDSLFGSEFNDIIKTIPDLIKVKEWDDNYRLLKEKEFLNFYVSGHPMQKFEPIIRSINNGIKKDFLSDEKNLKYCGIISSINKRRDKKNNVIAFVNVEEFNTTAECIFWSDTYSKYGHLLNEGDLIIIRGSLQDNDVNIKIIVNEVYELEEYIRENFIGYKIWLNEDDPLLEEKINTIHSNLVNEKYNPKKIRFFISNKDKSLRRTFVSLNCPIKFDLSAINFLSELLGNSNFQLEKN